MDERALVLTAVRELLEQLPPGKTLPLIRLAAVLGRKPPWSPAPLIRAALRIADEIEASGEPSEAALDALLNCCQLLRELGVEGDRS
jgi:hypothetical protein